MPRLTSDTGMAIPSVGQQPDCRLEEQNVDSNGPNRAKTLENRRLGASLVPATLDTLSYSLFLPFAVSCLLLSTGRDLDLVRSGWLPSP